MTEMDPSALWKIGWGYSAACNMTCPFCYSRLARSPDQEVPLGIAQRFIRQNAGDIACINYGTGESTLLPAWYELIASIREEYPSLRQALTTNGTLAAGQNGTTRRGIWARAIDEVDVSIDFADPDRHNRLRGNPRAYEWAVRTLDLCAEEGIIPTIVFVGFSDTLEVENLERLVYLARRHGAFLRMNILRPTPRVSLTPPTPAQAFAGVSWLLEHTRVVSLCDPLFGSLFDPDFQQQETTGVSSLRILPDGSITPSTYLISDEWKGASIYQDDFQIGKLGMNDVFRRIQCAPIPAECSGCEHAPICRGGAIDRRVLYYGTLEQRDPYCPYRNPGQSFSSVRPQRYSRPGSAPSVHDGYLPTLIFAP